MKLGIESVEAEKEEEKNEGCALDYETAGPGLIPVSRIFKNPAARHCEIMQSSTRVKITTTYIPKAKIANKNNIEKLEKYLHK